MPFHQFIISYENLNSSAWILQFFTLQHWGGCLLLRALALIIVCYSSLCMVYGLLMYDIASFIIRRSDMWPNLLLKYNIIQLGHDIACSLYCDIAYNMGVTKTDYQPGPWFNIKMSSYQYRKSHYGDKTVVRSSYLHNGISYAGKMSSLYWISPQAFNSQYISHNIHNTLKLWLHGCHSVDKIFRPITLCHCCQ